MVTHIAQSLNLKRTKYILLILILVLAATFISGGLSAESEEENPLGLQARAALLVNCDTGQILYDYRSHEPKPHASITKVMTLLVAMDALDRGDIRLDEMVTVTQEASSVIGSRIWLNPGDKITVEDLMKAVAVPSANDAAYALAQHIAGSEENFVRLMNERAKSMGLENTHFQNSTGLHGPEHYSSAYDIYLQSRDLITKHPTVLDWTSKWLMKIEAKNYSYPNTNRLVNPYERYEGVDGLKTGHTDDAQWCLVATAKRSNVRLISVILGAESEASRIAQTRTLLDHGFYNFKPISYEKDQVVGKATIPSARKDKVDVILDKTVTVLISKEKSQSDLSAKIEVLRSLNAPIEKGAQVGHLVIMEDERTLARVPVFAAEDVERANVFVRLYRWLRDLILSLIE
jgi:D-alanyl-D-alanine carboxypeptidase (penicillin-binding protein 5/6)